MKNQIKTILLLGVLSGLLVGIGSRFGPGWTYLAVVFSIGMNIAAYYFSDRIVLRMHGAQELAPDDAPWLHRMVEELSVKAGIPKPRVYLIDDPHANAFATGRNPEHGVVAVTQGIVNLLSRRELRGVLAHELAHIKNRDILISTIAAAVVGAISAIVNVLQWTLLLGMGSQQDEGEEGQSSTLGDFLLMLVAPLAATLVQLGISRSREYLADEEGARISGDPEALASALARLEHGAQLVPGTPQPATASLFIVNPLSAAGQVMNLFSTHPPMAERIARLRAMRPASYPRAA